jgi:hypothetical protein
VIGTTRPGWRLAVLATAVLGVAGVFALALARPGGQATSSQDDAEVAFRQVTLFGIVASPSDQSIAPKLLKIQPQLRKLKPGHGFRLMGVTSKRLNPQETVSLDLKGDGIAKAEMITPLNERGKVRFKFWLVVDGRIVFSTFVTMPPNQLFFCEKPRAGGERLLLGIGAR